MARICMIFNSFELPNPGGPSLQAYRVSQELKKRGHQIIFVAKGTGRSPAFEMVDGIPLYRLNLKGLASFQLLYRLWHLKNEFDILHVHGVGRLATMAITFARNFGKRVYVKYTIAGALMKPPQPGVKGWFKRISPFPKLRLEKHKQADGMIAISGETYNELINYGFPRDRISFIPNGVDTELFRPVGLMEKQQLRRKLGLPENKMIFIFTGKITRRKGVDTLLCAWQSLPQIQEKAVLVLVGDGKGQADNLEAWLDKFIQTNKLAGSVIWPGVVANVPDYLAAADCFLFPSWREGLPNSLLEAMSAGLVCFASNIGGNTDVIIPGKTGILLPPGDVGAWADAIAQAVNDPHPALGTAARRYICENYSIIGTANKLEKLYDDNGVSR
ncbi:glycosyltransferase family 4 protein [Sporolituus thermophilus]|uniref:Glycosyltransferase involved in cell wall bisynthesis n=1 Tax=Sporolituus thermophilus DSM 23256 TaxID=1123285 RepID=A0A1G7NFQ6_9FIRM|nr:glycosyltransferase family 4 protein [Sporolituus thermophilus]SDF72908.1 Glycosyltransferase involved in cell wall bisynthesis [Sporolituus thermophilus DSM 23256]